MRKKLRGSFTIEAAYIIPIILLVVAAILYLLFYYHDKNVLLGTAHETVAYGAHLTNANEDMIEDYFSSHIKGRMFLFTNIKKEIQVEEEHITIICEAKKGKLSVEVECSVSRTDPEDYIRSIRKMIKIGEEIGD